MEEKGQTTLDFAVGVSVFLIVVTFVLAFVPGMLDPFEASTQQETAAADRVAERLVTSTLVADAKTPYVLDRECTVAFFEDGPENTNDDGIFDEPFGTGTTTLACGFDDLPLVDRLALTTNGAPIQVHVRLVRDLTTAAADDPDGNQGGDDDVIETLCLDVDVPRIVESDAPSTCDPTGSEDVLFATGGTPPTDTGSVVVARRTVTVRGGFADGTNDAMLVVEVW